MAAYKINPRKSEAFLPTDNKYLEEEIRRAAPFIVTSKPSQATLLHSHQNIGGQCMKAPAAKPDDLSSVFHGGRENRLLQVVL